MKALAEEREDANLFDTFLCSALLFLAFILPAAIARAAWGSWRARVGAAAATATTEPWGLKWCGAFGFAFAAALARIGAGLPTLAGVYRNYGLCCRLRCVAL